MAKKAVGAIVIDDEKNDDWIKSLPGHVGEVELHDVVAKKLSKTRKAKSGKKSSGSVILLTRIAT